MEELAGVQRLRQGVRVVQAGHLLVSGFGVQADDITVVELGNQSQSVTNGGKEDIAAGFVGLGLKTDAEVVSAGLDVSRNSIQAFAVAIKSGV